MELPKAEDLKSLVSALSPGLIILGIRQPFMSTAEPEIIDRAIKYAAVSSIYYAVVHPVLLLAQHSVGLSGWGSNASEYILIPIFIGIVAAIGVRKEWAFRLWQHFDNPPVHPVPTAWDYLFGRMRQDAYLIVTLSDGSQVAGRYGEGSFASSSDAERDLLIGEVWDLEGQKWSKLAEPKSILLCGRDIKHIEIIHGDSNDREAVGTA